MDAIYEVRLVAWGTAVVSSLEMENLFNSAIKSAHEIGLTCFKISPPFSFTQGQTAAFLYFTKRTENS